MIVIIPSRYDSVRLPGKPLVDLNGKTLIERVYDCAVASNASKVLIATDDERIESEVNNFGGEALITSANHLSGTDRINEAITMLSLDDDEIIINLQGDEPLMPVSVINQIADTLQSNPGLSMATACFEINDIQDLQDPNLVKVVKNKNNHALYFSRAPIPYTVDENYRENHVLGLGHIGIYGYRAGFVRKFSTWPACSLEKREKLEQLRALHYGVDIHVTTVSAPPGPGVDTQADLELVRKLFAEKY